MSKTRLYYTPNSPYARIARVAARDSGLADRITEIVAETRRENTPYFKVTPLARVPVLVDGAVTVADTRDICRYFDEISGQVRWCPDEDHQARYIRQVVSGFLDGIAVWLRENARPEGQRSESVMRYEEHRARNALGWLEPHWREQRVADYTSLVLCCAVDIALDRGMAGDWTRIAPGILAWVAERATGPVMRETAPLPA